MIFKTSYRSQRDGVICSVSHYSLVTEGQYDGIRPTRNKTTKDNVELMANMSGAGDMGVKAEG